MRLYRPKLILSAVMLAVTSSVSHAYTLDEIFGGKTEIQAIESKQEYTGFTRLASSREPRVKTKFVGSFGVTMQRVAGSDTQIKISGICFHEYYAYDTYSFIFTLAENGVESSNGSQFIIRQDQTAFEDGKTGIRYATLKQRGSWYTGYYYYYDLINKDVVFNITQNTDGTFTFLTDGSNTVILDCPNNHGFWDAATDVLEFTTYEANSSATETFEDWYLTDPSAATATRGQKITRSYPVNVVMNFDTKTCTITNFANQGYMLESSKAQNNSDLTGTINTIDHTITFNETPGYVNQGRYIDPYSDNVMYTVDYKLCTWNGVEGGTVTPGATAKYDEQTDVHHNDVEHSWVTNGGTRRTWGGAVIYFEDPLLFFNKSSRSNRSGWVDYAFGPGFKGWNHMFEMPTASAVYYDMVIGKDVTLDVDLAVNHFGVDSQRVYVNATLTENKNFEYVDHYELWMVPGTYDNITDAGFTHHLDNGHVDAICITDFISDWTPSGQVRAKAPAVARPAGGIGRHTFNVIVPAEKIGEIDENSNFTFFVKANYKADKNLAPTFHSLAYKLDNPTGVDDITSDATDDVVRYFNLNGVEVDGDNLTPGVYVRLKAGAADKVVIK